MLSRRLYTLEALVILCLSQLSYGPYESNKFVPGQISRYPRFQGPVYGYAQSMRQTGSKIWDMCR